MIEQIRSWCYRVLPLTYDDSLSYYEVLCKVTDKLNELIKAVNTPDLGFTFADPIEWEHTKAYPKNMIVSYDGALFVSKQEVPSGIQITDKNYWEGLFDPTDTFKSSKLDVITGRYNRQPYVQFKLRPTDIELFPTNGNPNLNPATGNRKSIYQYAKTVYNKGRLFSNCALTGKYVFAGIPNDFESMTEACYYCGITRTGMKFVADLNNTMSAATLKTMLGDNVFPVFTPLVVNAAPFDYDSFINNNSGNAKVTRIKSIENANPRNIMGFDADGFLNIIAVSGRVPSNPGLTYKECITFAQQLGLIDAAMCDGGGSVEVAYEDSALIPSFDTAYNYDNDLTGEGRHLHCGISFGGV